MCDKLLVRKAVVSILLLFACFISRAGIITIESSVSEINRGSLFEVEIWAKDLNSEIISAFDLDLAYSQENFELKQLFFGAALGGGIDSFQDQNQMSGSVAFSELSFLLDNELINLQGGIEFLIATMQFSAVGLGNGSMSIESAALVGADFLPLNFDTSSTFQIQVVAQQVSEPYIASAIMLTCLLLTLRNRFFKVNFEELRT